MGSYSNTAVTPGSGANIKHFGEAGGDRVQIVRDHKASAETDNSWTVSTTASTSQIAADANRVGMLIVSDASARVYLRFDATAPTSSVYHWYLDPGDRWEVPGYLVELAVSMLGASAGGTILSHLATAS